MRSRSLAVFLIVICAGATLDAQSTSRRRSIRMQACDPGVIVSHAGVTGIAVDSQHVYFTNSRGELYRLARSGGPPRLLASIPGTESDFIAIDGTNVYFQSRGRSLTDSVYAVPKAGGEPVLLLQDLRGAFELVANGEWLYILEAGTLRPGSWLADGEIVRVRKDGSAHETIASNLKAPAAMELDGDFIYFTECGTGPADPAGGVRRVAKSGGAVTSIATVVGAWALAQDMTTLYVLRNIGQETGEIDAVSKLDGTVTPMIAGIRFEVIAPIEVYGDALYFMNLVNGTTARIEVLPLHGGDWRSLREFQWNFPQIEIDSCGVYFSTPYGIERAGH